MRRVFWSTSMDMISGLSRRGDDFLSGIFHRIGDNKVEARLLKDFSTLLDIGSFQPKNHRQANLRFFGSFNHPFCERVYAQNAAEDIDQHCFHIPVAEQNLESVLDLLGIGSAAYV